MNPVIQWPNFSGFRAWLLVTWESCARSFLSCPSLIVNHPASIRPSVNFFSLSHLLRDHWSDFFKTCLRCATIGSVVFAQNSSICAHRQPSLIFTVIASPFETCLRCSTSDLVVFSPPHPTPKNGPGPSINVTAGSHLWFSPLSHLIWNHWRNFVETLHMNSFQCLDMSARKWFCSVNKYGRTAHYSTLQKSRYRMSFETISWIFFENLSDMFN